MPGFQLMPRGCKRLLKVRWYQPTGLVHRRVLPCCRLYWAWGIRGILPLDTLFEYFLWCKRKCLAYRCENWRPSNPPVGAGPDNEERPLRGKTRRTDRRNSGGTGGEYLWELCPDESRCRAAGPSRGSGRSNCLPGPPVSEAQLLSSNFQPASGPPDTPVNRRGGWCRSYPENRCVPASESG